MTLIRRLTVSFSGVILIAVAWLTRDWSGVLAMSLVPIGVGFFAAGVLRSRSSRMAVGLRVLAVTTLVSPVFLIVGSVAAKTSARREAVRKHGRDFAKVRAGLIAQRVKEITNGHGRCPTATEIDHDAWIGRDPWGQPFVIECDLARGKLRVTSKGPDGYLGSDDDVCVETMESASVDPVQDAAQQGR